MKAVTIAAFCALLGSACADGKLDLFERQAAVVNGTPNPESTLPSTPSPAPQLNDAGPEQDAAAPSSMPTASAAPSTPSTPSTMMSADAAVPAPRPDFILLDDLEDGNTQALATSGWWYPTNDGTQQQLMFAETHSDRPGSTVALRTSGSDFSAWGALIGVDLTNPAGFFDVTPTNALRFWARSAVARNVAVRFVQQGSITLSAEVTLNLEWTEHTVPFSAFAFSGNPALVLTPEALQHLQVFFGLEPFDVWLDDVAFVTVP
jgi:hypothetical protein